MKVAPESTLGDPIECGFQTVGRGLQTTEYAMKTNQIIFGSSCFWISTIRAWRMNESTRRSFEYNANEIDKDYH